MTTTTPDKTILHTVERRDVTTATGEQFRRVRAEFGLRKIGDQSPYFTVTVEAWSPGNFRRDDPDMGGSAHELAREVFPELTDIIALHLSDADGTPMHAHANGWYWFSDYDGRGGTNPSDEFAGLSPQQRAEFYLRAPAGHFDGVLTRAEFDGRVDALREQWKREAKAAIDFYGLTS